MPPQTEKQKYHFVKMSFTMRENHEFAAKGRHDTKYGRFKTPDKIQNIAHRQNNLSFTHVTPPKNDTIYEKHFI